MSYSLLKKVIDSGKYIKADILTKLDAYLLFGKISIEQYDELTIIILGKEE
jgi:hypothetical protein